MPSPRLFIYLLLLSSTLPASRLDGLLGVLVPFAIVLSGLLYGLVHKRVPIQVDKLFLLLATALFGAFTLSAIVSPTDSRTTIPPAVFVGVYMTTFVAAVFIIPRLVPTAEIIGAIARISAIAVVAGLPVLIIEIGSGGGIPLYYQSYFANPNTLGVLCALGTIAAGSEYLHSKSKHSLLISAITLAGVVASSSRNAMLGLGVGVGILVAFAFAEQEGVIGITMGGATVAIIGAGMFAQVLPDPFKLHTISLTYRAELWLASLRAFSEAPIFGLGVGDLARDIAPYQSIRQLRPDGVYLGTHNSYLRVLLQTGIVGGVAYVLLIGLGIVSAVRQAKSPLTAGIASILIAASTIQFFEAYTILGLRSVSIIPALALGVVLTNTINTRE